jgi:hypothetical protein
MFLDFVRSVYWKSNDLRILDLSYLFSKEVQSARFEEFLEKIGNLADGDFGRRALVKYYLDHKIVRSLPESTMEKSDLVLEFLRVGESSLVPSLLKDSTGYGPSILERWKNNVSRLIK